MSRFVVAAWDGGGTVPPTLGLVAALVGAGHAAVVLGDDTMEHEAVAAGATFTPWRAAPQARARDAERALIRDWELKNPLKQVRQIGDLLFFGPAAEHAADLDAAIGEFAPDALVVDAMLTGASAAAERSGLPTAAIAPNVNLLRAPGVPPMGMGLRPMAGRVGRTRDRALHWLNDTLLGTGTLNETRQAMGLAPVGSLEASIRRADRVILLTSAAFDFVPTQPDPQVVYGGIPIPPDELAGADWSAPWSADGRPRVLVSLSTTYMAQEDLLGRLVEAVGGVDAHALVTVGAGMRGRRLPAAPPNVTLTEFAPHGSVLPDVDLVVTHGGHGTVVRALAAGVPVLVVPIGRDQPDNAARVVHHGVGASVSRRASPTRLRAKIEELLGDADLRRRTAAFAELLRPDLGAPQAVAALTDLVGSAHRP